MNASKFLPLLIAVALAACGEKASAPADVAASIAPVATVVVAGSASASAAPAAAAAAAAAAPAASAPAPAAAPEAAPAKPAGGADLAKGEKIYAATCLACHGAGVLGAPKFGDKAAWGPRIAKGIDVLHANALNGVNMMPPRGGNAALKDEDLKLAVDYMVSKAK